MLFLSILLFIIIINLIYLKININFYKKINKNQTAELSPTIMDSKDNFYHLKNTIKFEDYNTQIKDNPKQKPR